MSTAPLRSSLLCLLIVTACGAPTPTPETGGAPAGPPDAGQQAGAVDVAPTVASCGDGQCTEGETAEACPADCTGCGDGQCTDAESAASCQADCGPDTFVFPMPTDEIQGEASGDRHYFWRQGQFVRGARTTRHHAIDRVEVAIAFEENGLECDTQDVEVRINGTAVGTIRIARGEQVATGTFRFNPIAGPQVTIQYFTVRQVESGCGAAAYSFSGNSKITLFGP